MGKFQNENTNLGQKHTIIATREKNISEAIIIIRKDVGRNNKKKPGTGGRESFLRTAEVRAWFKNTNLLLALFLN